MKAEANLDGKYLLRCSDPHLPAADIALGYKQLLEVEPGWPDMKQILDPAPGLSPPRRTHPRPRRALLAGAAPDPPHRDPTGQTWHHVRRDLDRLHAVTFTGPTGTFRQRTDPTKPQIDLYARLELPLQLPLPKKIIEISTAEC